MDAYDFIVVGGGSAGCVLANRLSANPSVTVALLEAGSTDARFASRLPVGVPLLLNSADTNWKYMANADPSRGGRVDEWPAGRLLGGGSAVNGMLYVRGHRRDYDQWAQLGAVGWSYADVEPYFQRLEASERGPAPGRGTDGPLSIAECRAPHRLDTTFLEALNELGVPRVTDLNNGDAEGVDLCQVSQKNGLRHSTAQAYLRPIRSRSNLHVRTRCEVQRVEFDHTCSPPRATGVCVAESNGTAKTLSARRGVVLCAGAIATPKLLMLSGIGAPRSLRRHGIAQVKDLPGVGTNLQEHIGLRMSAHVNVPTAASDMSPLRGLAQAYQFLMHRRGTLTMPVGHAQAMVRTRTSLEIPNVQLIFSPFAMEVSDRGASVYRRPAITVAVGLCRPRARGSVSLADTRPDDPPVIEYRAFEDTDDLTQLVEGAEFTRRVFATQAFRPFIIDEHLPGKAIANGDALREYTRDNAFLMYHPCGTCRMGADAMSVVSPALDVHGVAGLWVADASVIPQIPAGNINATCIMIGEKAADLIREHADSPT